MNKQYRLWRGAMGLLVCGWIAACAQTQSLISLNHQDFTASGSDILLVGPDVEISSLGVSGIAEPNAEWTVNAENNIIQGLRDEMESRATSLSVQPNSELSTAARIDLQKIKKLYQKVAATIITRRFVPTAQAKKDWTLGSGVKTLQDARDHDLALFVFFRDQHATGGRIAAQIGLSLIGVHIPTAVQVGHAALVDLDNGDVIWFNQLAHAGGDLRELEPARSSIKNLLADIPI